LIKYIKSVLWRVAKCLSYIEEAQCLKVKSLTTDRVVADYRSSKNSAVNHLHSILCLPSNLYHCFVSSFHLIHSSLITESFHVLKYMKLLWITVNKYLLQKT